MRRRTVGVSSGEKMRLELHCHSTRSDGSLSPTELATRAAARDVELFCLTDHDTMGGYEETAAALPGVRVLRGLEMSCKFGGRTVHLLMYGVREDAGGEQLRARLEDVVELRHQRIPRMVEKLEALGFPLDLEALQAKLGNKVPGRPDVAAALVEAGHCTSMREAFDRFLKDDGPAYVDVDRISLGEGVELGTAAGARMSIAHPHTLRTYGLVEDAYRQHRDAGLTGIEAFYGPYQEAQRAPWLKLARDWDLVATGGSDFHGAATPAVREPVIDLAAPHLEPLLEWLAA